MHALNTLRACASAFVFGDGIFADGNAGSLPSVACVCERERNSDPMVRRRGSLRGGGGGGGDEMVRAVAWIQGWPSLVASAVVVVVWPESKAGLVLGSRCCSSCAWIWILASRC